MDLSLGLFMVIFSDTLLELLGLDIAKELKINLLTISLLGATIQDGGIEERSNDSCWELKSYILILESILLSFLIL